MLLKHFILYSIIAAFISCKGEDQAAKTTQPKPQVSVPSSNVTSIDNDFSAFIELFSKDTTFQRNRTKFPLQIKQYVPGYDKDTIIYVQESAFEMMDFRKKKSDSVYDEWKQEIVLDKSQEKATIEIRGIDNGIIVDYYFEKIDGRWVFVGMYDSST